ncbi:PepSY domain-containing protein [Pseudomonas sp. PDNC002]|uniref:PepSY domain-containing protein n=1 Tax=Pseudomonas sp. PDNC002 TaxID=2811422 RepID=UPI0019652FD3|nr:PepSY domain-containing protein [Pseudomonas sp. PDNC002]QRY77169.1 PepSY domain-containing protein [Pseudomonas sp. PDNC002]
MWKLWLSLIALGSAPLVHADTQCTRADKSTWKQESAFRSAMKQQGYRITKFRVTPGNCYEIYGFNPLSHRVELYFHPVTFALVKAEPVVRR